MKIIQNMDRELFCASLNTKDENGIQNSVHLVPRQKSRPLTDEEMQSPEILATLRKQNLGGYNKRVLKVIDASQSKKVVKD